MYSQRQHRSYKQEVRGQRGHGLTENLEEVFACLCQVTVSGVRGNFSEN